METIWRVMVRLVSAPFTRQALGDLGFCVLGAWTGTIGFLLLAVVLLPGMVMIGTIIGAIVGLLLVIAAIGVARLLGTLHRGVLRITTGERIPAAPAVRSGTDLVGWLARRLRDRDGWRAVGYAWVKLPVAIAEGYAVACVTLGLIDLSYPLGWGLFRTHPEPGEKQGPMVAVVPVPNGHWAIVTWAGTLAAAFAGALCILAGLWLARGMTALDARLMRSMLGPSRLSVLERTRAIAVEDAAAALRRVERDLHDGAQVRLAAVAMNLGMAQEKAGDETLRDLLDAAQAGVSGALADLRRIARGIHPPALDTGLADAVTSLAAQSPIPARVQVELAVRPSPAIETMAYFCVAELLANAIKHSSANAIEVTIDNRTAGKLRVRVTDDGAGGADPARGTGLAGLAQRASVVDGKLRVSSPPGGPTTVTAELPMQVPGEGS
jgi:signal transduction histidine kinase